MPPKSSNSKKNQNSWFFCAKCETNLISKDRDGHEKICDEIFCGKESQSVCKTDFIRKHMLHTSTIGKRDFSIEELKDVSEKQLNNLIFISEGVMKLCNFIIGQDVSISSEFQTTDPAPAVKMVRKVWPIPEKFLTTVFFSSQDHNNYSQSLTRIIVKKLASVPRAVKELIVDVVETSGLELSDVWKKLSKVLQVELRGRVFCRATRVYLDFFNKNIEMVLKSFQTYKDVEDISDQMESLSFDDNFYLITTNTRIVLANKFQVESSEEVKENRVKLKDVGGLEKQMHEILQLFEIAVGFKYVPRGKFENF